MTTDSGVAATVFELSIRSPEGPPPQPHPVVGDGGRPGGICGIYFHSFDRLVEGGFRTHVRDDHNMWNYLFFMHCPGCSEGSEMCLLAKKSSFGGPHLEM